ncbi:MAG TPA: DUF4105 domain-containing protein [Gemmatimonadales bacterium]|nr:DUF4105 domain-containing protein [Gemmatimonadales bacterium]
MNRFLPALALVMMTWAAPVSAQEPVRTPGESLRVSLVTMGPGAPVWEQFGHNAIMIEDGAAGEARWYNYGMFDFAAADFWPRFLRGDMRYWMVGADAEASLRSYIRANRSVWVQELDLTAAERAAMRDFLVWNERPENRFYAYDYFRDNCSTRVRDALDRILGGALRAATESLPAATTWRDDVRRLTAAHPWIYTGTELTMARPTDAAISRWAGMWLPSAVREEMGQLRRTGADGVERPLVRSETTLFLSTTPDPLAAPPTRWPWYLLIGVLGGGAMAWLGRHSGERRAARIGFVVLGSAWSFLAGLGGVVLAGLWILTNHTAAHANENLLQFSPVSLVMLVALPLALRTPRAAHPRTVRLALALVVLSATGLLLKLLPGPSQMNWEIIALSLPLHLGLAVGLHHEDTKDAKGSS